MSQTDSKVTYVSAADLLGKTDRTKLITVELPELEGDDGAVCAVLLRPPTAATAQKFLTGKKVREAVEKVKKGQAAEVVSGEEFDSTMILFVEALRDLAVTPQRERLYPADTAVDQIMQGLPAGAMTRIVQALSASMSAGAEEGADLGKKPKKNRRSGGATKSPGGAA